MIKEACQAFKWDGAHRTATCSNWDTWALNMTRHLHPAAIILATNYTEPSGVPTRSLTGLTNEIKALASIAPVIVIQDPPRLPKLPIDCVLTPGATYGACTFTLTSADLSGYTAAANAATALHATTIPTLQWFVADNKSPMVVDNTFTYIDDNHVSATYATKLEGALSHELAAAIKNAYP